MLLVSCEEESHSPSGTTIQSDFSVLEDPDEQFSAEELFGRPMESMNLPFKHSKKGAVWVKVDLQHDQEQVMPTVISFSHLAYVSLFQSINGDLQEFRSGFLRSGSEIRGEDGLFHFSLRLPPGQGSTILLQVRDVTHLGSGLSFEIQPREEYWQNKMLNSRLRLLTSGAFWAMFIYLFFAFVINRSQRSYLHLLVFTGALGLYSLSIRGDIIQYIFPETPIFGWALNETFYHLAFIGALLFMLDFYQVKKFNPKFFRAMIGLTAFMALKGIGGFFYIYFTQDSSTLLTLNIATFPFETLAPGTYLMLQWKRFSNIQRNVLWAVMGISLLCLVRIVVYWINAETQLETLGFLADLGGIVSILIFSAGLISESKLRLRQRNEALAEKNALQKEQNTRLEALVKVRTEEVSHANQELRVANQDLQERNEQIRLLISEIHHRVKNNFQLVTSLLDVQAKYLEDNQLIGVLNESQVRIRSMALIHQRLYDRDSVEDIHFPSYARELLDEIAAIYQQETPLISSIEAPDVSFGIDTAVPLGLIMNELITNAFKYGFDPKTPELMIILQETDKGVYQLEVSDNGPGMSGEVWGKRGKSYGLRLVRRLAQQLHGGVEYTNNGSSTFRISFKRKKPHSS